MDSKKVIRQGYADGTPVAEIAAQLHISKTAVKNRAYRDPECPQHRGIFKVKENNTPTQQEMSLLKELCEAHNLPFDQWKMWWYKIPEHSICFQNSAVIEQEKRMFDDFIERVRKRSPTTKKSPLPTKTLAIPSAYDTHIGKHCELVRTGNDYTPEKAVTQVREGVQALMTMTQPFHVSDMLLPLGNDIIHVDNNSYTSTSGTPQDSYGSVESQMLLATELYIGLITEMAENYNVWLCHIHSNHDRVSGWAISQIVAAHFYSHPRVRWSTDGMSQQHRKYFVFGDNLIMFHHGEGKEEKLMGIIESEAREAVAQTKRTYVYQGHVHHKQTNRRGINTENVEKDHSAITTMKSGNGAENRMHVETVRSPSPADDWHSRNIFSNMPAVELFLHNDHAQFARFTHWF